MARSALVSPIDETTIGGTVDRDLPMTTHADGMAILDEYFPKSTIDSRLLNGASAPNELSTSITDISYRNFPLVPSILPLALKAFNASLDIISLKTSIILDRHNATGGFETSIPSTGSLESVSSCRDSLSCPSSKNDGTDMDLIDIAACTPFAKRLVLDDAAQLLEHILAALENVYDNSRNPSSSLLRALDYVLAESDHVTFMKIMSSLIENWAKCNCLIAKPALVVAEELREVERNSLKRI